MLEESIQRLVSYKSFDADVELVIADNCSTDDTQQVGERYASRYDNVRYFRNQENILDGNFVNVLDKGRGRYLKLMNDWCRPTEQGLAAMKQFHANQPNDDTPVFFTSGWARPKGDSLISCKGLDDYVRAASVMVTFNNLFGTWKSDWDTLTDKERFKQLKLQQVDWTYRLVSGRGCLLFNDPVIEFSPEMNHKVRQGYNYFEVMLDNYYAIMQRFVDQGLLQRTTMEKDERHFLQHFRPELFQALVCHTGKYWNYDTTGTWKRLFAHYGRKPYFYGYIAALPFQWLFHASVRDFGK